MMENKYGIIAENVSKKFRIGFKKNQSALARFISFFSGKEPKRTIKALENLSFHVKKGDILGVIGKNGSGKSTLLRCIAGIYDYEGKIETKGKIIPLINLNIGFQLRLTMKDNIFLVGSLFGLSKKELEKRFDSIVHFSELEEFVSTKIYQFSEGMKQRLAFSIAIHCNPEILLLDEVFEVGDEIFRKKSAEKIKEIVKNGSSVILVSHELYMIEKYCHRVIWMSDGKIILDDKTKEVLKKYKHSELKKEYKF